MHLSRALTAKLAACILAVTAVITPSFAASVGTVVSDSGLNVRAEASAESQVFTTLSSGTQVDVLSTTGDGKWHKISSNGITGFVAGDYLKVTEEKIYGQVVAISTIVAVTVAAVCFTGIMGNLCAPLLVRLFRVKDPVAAGLAIGACSHAMGTARALELGETEGAMSGLAIGLCGLATTILALFFDVLV